MKKVQKLTIIILFTTFMCVFFIGCSINTENSLKNKLSEYTSSFFVSQMEDYYITINSGKRESNYQFDGNTSELIDFALVTLTFKKGSTLDEIPYTITINNKQLSGILEKNPYKSNFMCDLKMQINDEDTININLFDSDHEMISKSKDFQITNSQAEKIAIDHLNDNISSVIKNKDQIYECYLKLVYKPEVCENVYWYYLVKADKYYNVIIDTHTGEIIANY